MSDSEVKGETPKPKITSDAKEKNPGRVAAGKKLTAMNRARMSRTVNRYDATEPTQHEVDDHDTTDWSSPMVLLTVVGVVSGLGCLYYTYKQDKRLETSPISQTRDVLQTSEEPQQSSRAGSKTPRANPDLRTRGSQPPSSLGGGNLKSFD